MQRHETITKPSTPRDDPNLADYDATRASFDWADVEEEIDFLPGGGLNLAYEAIDRHVVRGNGDKPAMLWEGKNGEKETYTYDDMRRQTNRFANVLGGLGVEKGTRVFTFMERVPEIYFTVFGTLKAGCVIGPLFSAFGPDPVRDRMEDSGAKVLVTQPDLRKKIAEILPQLPDLEHIIVVNKNGRSAEPLAGGDLDYYALMNEASDDFGPIATTRDDYSIMHYTSGTTGKPKGAVHRHNAVIQHYLTGKWCLDLHPDDIYWCTADPGWVTGTSYGMSAPWTNGVTQVIYEGGFSARKWYQVLEDYNVTVWYTAPTAIRMLMKSGVELPKTFDLSNLRFAASVGEPLNPEAVEWGVEAIGMPFHDNWWQTETGGIMIANYACMDIRPGSMGRPLPGINPGIIDADGNEKPDGTEGNLAVRTPWPSMFQTYWQQQERYDSRFVNGWYITGDEAVRDSDGYYWFIGRSDDVINTAGHLVGPFEVESALIEHPAVAEAGVIGKPDPIAMEVVKAFVSLKDGYEPSDELRRELMGFARQKLAAAVAPREIEIIPGLPKTRSGKIMRRLLKARELGLDEGDTSTLEED
ncbi:MAG: acetate--CoA ligase [Chloroflexota bacterium]|nr:acetate--CoA ligase [Chloroflexota bacterium]MDE2885949.1 acetate--CoA ligase [Chloroflexota bacterium]